MKMWPLEHNSDEKECDPEEDGNAEKNVDENLHFYVYKSISISRRQNIVFVP